MKAQVEYDENYPPLFSSPKKLPACTEIFDQDNNRVENKRIMDHNIVQKDLTTSQDEKKSVNFNHIFDNQQLTFEVQSDRRVRCSICKNIYKNIPHHLRSGKCKIMDFDRFTRYFNQFMLIQFKETRKKKLCEKSSKIKIS